MDLNSRIRDANIALMKCDSILKFDFSAHYSPQWISESAFCLLLVSFRDILGFLSKVDKRVNFTDDLPEGRDVTDQIIKFRNAICHFGSADRRVLGTGPGIHFCMRVGTGTIMQIGDIELSNPYQDDIAFFYGDNRLLLNRHLKRAFNIAHAEAKAVAETNGVNWFQF